MAEAPNEPVVGDAPPKANVLLSNKVYDVLKWVCVIFLPAFGSFYLGLGAIWEEIPDTERVVATVVLLETTLGLLLGVTNVQYARNTDRFAGTIVYEGIDGPDPKVALVPKDEWKAYQDRDQVSFKIKRRS